MTRPCMTPPSPSPLPPILLLALICLRFGLGDLVVNTALETLDYRVILHWVPITVRFELSSPSRILAPFF